MCMACGQMLKGTEVKCPSCGAPIRSARGPRRSSRLVIAGVLFLGLVLTSASVAGIALFRADEIVSGGPSFFASQYAVSGHVRDGNGSIVAGARVVADGGTNTTTDANGSYQFPPLSAGYHRFTFNATGHGTWEERVFLHKPLTLDASLPPGGAHATHRHESYDASVQSVHVWGWILVAVTLVLLGGAVACFRKRHYPLAVTASWLSLLTVFFPPALLVSIVLIILVLRSKAEFA